MILFCVYISFFFFFFFFSSRRRHTRFKCDWSSDVCSSDLLFIQPVAHILAIAVHGQRFPAPGIQNNEGNQLFRELKWTVVVRTVGCEYGRSEERRVGKECRSGGVREC